VLIAPIVVETELPMILRLKVLGVVACCFALSAVPAQAAPSGPTGSIELAQVTSLVDRSWPRYGDSVFFETRVSGRLAAKSRVYVSVVCVQGVTVLYQWSADPSFTFPLVDQAGQGLEWDGGAASCTAALVYRVESGKQPSISYLDQTAFAVAGV
jgi:hypothetical protein